MVLHKKKSCTFGVIDGKMFRNRIHMRKNPFWYDDDRDYTNLYNDDIKKA